MMRKTERLLEDYGQADFTKRLHLYLEYPDLRTEFTEIERSAPAPSQRAVKRCDSPATDRGCTWPRFLLRPGFEKRCCR